MFFEMHYNKIQSFVIKIITPSTLYSKCSVAYICILWGYCISDLQVNKYKPHIF